MSLGLVGSDTLRASNTMTLLGGRRPNIGADRLARYLVGGLGKVQELVAFALLIIGQLAIRVELKGRPACITSLTAEDGQVTGVYSIANPDKLSRHNTETALSR